jgi:hypothetical protein
LLTSLIILLQKKTSIIIADGFLLCFGFIALLKENKTSGSYDFTLF